MITDLAVIIRNLRASIAECSPHGVARPMWVQDVRDVIDLIERQEAEITAFRAQQWAINTAMIQATIPADEVEVEA
jgi:hypothetical protein